MNFDRRRPFGSSSLPVLVLLLAALALVGGCAAKAPRPSQGMMDTPLHHYRTGMRLLDEGRPAEAEAAFGHALELQKDYGPAFVGRGVAAAEQGRFEEAEDLADEGRDRARTPRQELWALTGLMRVYAAMGRAGLVEPGELDERVADLLEDGLDLVEDDAEAHALDKEVPGLHFYAGQAYLQALDLDAAEAAFERVIALNRGLERRAEARWSLIQKVRRAAPRTELGLRIALADSLTRADMAALLVEELGVERFFEGTTLAAESAFHEPSAAAGGEPVAGNATARAAAPDTAPVDSLPDDVRENPMREDVAVVLDYGVRGLETFPDGRFRPAEPLSRAEFVLVLEDVIVRATRDASLATRNLGAPSPFPDVRPDQPFFNAAVLAVSRSLLQADGRTGRFEPLGPVPGVDAVLALAQLRQDLGIF
ncbi:MAG: tetratricopeptide repeat protein [Desulfovibrionaceae bacterium]|jgi:hypothetical protein|nr:tetratricopeptide repeat protein [Desulfovibrionaceae bacterium]